MILFENGAASVGIIGGADGPTAIFVSGPTFLLELLSALVILFFIALAVYVIRRKK